jgi:hypothetical protein
MTRFREHGTDKSRHSGTIEVFFSRPPAEHNVVPPSCQTESGSVYTLPKLRPRIQSRRRPAYQATTLTAWCETQTQPLRIRSPCLIAAVQCVYARALRRLQCCTIHCRVKRLEELRGSALRGHACSTCPLTCRFWPSRSFKWQSFNRASAIWESCIITVDDIRLVIVLGFLLPASTRSGVLVACW